MLCPFCLQEVTKFKNISNKGGYKCPKCNESIPIIYVREYDNYSHAVFTLIGFSGHGKTCYLASLFMELENTAPKLWTEFSWAPIDEKSLIKVRQNKKALASGKLPNPTPNIFPRPVILQLNRVPLLEFKDWHLIAYDISGEAFEQVEHLKKYGSYLAHAPVVVWLLSIPDLEGPNNEIELIDFIIKYKNAILELGGNPKKQTLLLVLTKGDELSQLFTKKKDEDSHEHSYRSQKSFKNDRSMILLKKVEQFLMGGNSNFDLHDFNEVSQMLLSWLESNCKYTNFIRVLKEQFIEIQCTIVSALGAKPNKQRLPVSPTPRKVLVPLLQVLSLEAPRQTKLKEQQKAIRMQKEKAEKMRIKLTRLSPWNPWHWLKLLFLVFYRTNVLNWLNKLNEHQKSRFNQVDAWLTSTLIWNFLFFFMDRW